MRSRAVTTPNEQQFYDALAPDLKRKVDDSRAYQKAAREKYDRLEALKVSFVLDSLILRRSDSSSFSSLERSVRVAEADSLMCVGCWGTGRASLGRGDAEEVESDWVAILFSSVDSVASRLIRLPGLTLGISTAYSVDMYQ